jgi:hypothetical protein
MTVRSGFRERLREIHGDDVEITVTPHRAGVGQAPRLNAFGVILALPALLALCLVIVVLGVGVCAFAGIFAGALFGPVVGWITAGLIALLVVGVLQRGTVAR